MTHKDKKRKLDVLSEDMFGDDNDSNKKPLEQVYLIVTNTWFENDDPYDRLYLLVGLEMLAKLKPLLDLLKQSKNSSDFEPLDKDERESIKKIEQVAAIYDHWEKEEFDDKITDSNAIKIWFKCIKRLINEKKIKTITPDAMCFVPCIFLGVKDLMFYF